MFGREEAPDAALPFIPRDERRQHRGPGRPAFLGQGQ